MARKKFLIFAGTTEGRILASHLSEKFDVTVCVATAYGEELLREEGCGIRILSGRKDATEIRRLLQEDFSCVIDATHPYAREATANIRKACFTENLPYYRLRREESRIQGAVSVSSVEEAALFLAAKEGNVLLTTGSKELEPFLRIQNWAERLYVRALPTQENLEKCARLEIPPSHLCLMQGPFPQELECAFLRHWKITFVVMKDSGKEGGTEEKLAAARQCGVEAVVIQRPPEPDGFLLTELEQKLFQEFGSTIAVGGKNGL